MLLSYFVLNGTMGIVTAVQQFITNPVVMGVWVVLMVISLGVLVWDLRANNEELGSLMKYVWGFTVFYSGPIGLAVYWFSGRTQIAHDSLWRRGFRSVCHCYSGCGAGEISGVLIAVGLLSLRNLWVAALTFLLAYVFGYAMTMGPLIQEGMEFREAFVDAFYSETASIAVMEIVAIATDLWLAGEAKMHEPLFWAALVVSLSAGLLAAYPVNLLLIRRGVKEGMMNPAEMS